MAYFDESTGKECLIREIHTLAERLDRYVDFDPVWMLDYGDLVDLKHELLKDIIQEDSHFGEVTINAHKVFREN